MKYLLDTNAVIFALSDYKKVPKKAHRIISNLENELYLSIASLWEITIKSRLGKIDLGKQSVSTLSAAAIKDVGVSLLPIEIHHLELLQGLPLHHRDPFDRLLIVQAQALQAGIVSTDEQFDLYRGLKRIWD